MQNDRTRTAPVKARTLSRRMQRRMRIAERFMSIAFEPRDASARKFLSLAFEA
jgi:hypothetical protein